MNKSLLGATAAALILTGCAQNDLLNGPGINTPNDGKIRFAASTGLNTKAATDNPFNSTGDLQKLGVFSVKGFVEGTGTDLIGDDMKWNVSSSSWEYKNNPGAEPYWPSTWMDFYAHANWATAPTINADPTTGGITATGVTVGADYLTVSAGQKDLLVAITPNATKEARTLLTFKHALTQIVFKAGNVNFDKFNIKIAGVELLNVMSRGDVSFAKNDMKITWPKVNLSTITNYEVKGIAEHDVAEIKTGDENKYNLFPRIQTAIDPASNALMLIPQEFDAWNPNLGTVATATTAGASIKVVASLCDKTKVTDITLLAAKTDAEQKALQIYVFCGKVEYINTGDHTQGSKLTPGALYIPVASKPTEAGYWEPGKRINYIISFGDGESGSGGGGYDNNGNPILVPIKFRAVVEDWTEISIPLLSVNIAATSNVITHKFIDGFTNQLLNEIKATPAPTKFTAKLTFNGATSASIGVLPDALLANDDANVSFLNAIDPAKAKAIVNTKFLPGSTITYDFTGVTENGLGINLFTPNGWGVKGPYVMEKVAVSGYDFITKLGFIQDNLVALELNEKGSSSGCGNTIWVNGAVDNHFTFSCEPLAKLTTTPKDATVTVNMTAVTGWTTDKDVTTWCPAGWKATAGGKTYAGGETILLIAAGNIVFTKVTSTYTVIYNNQEGLKTWLATNPTSGSYYYNNVDFDVEINDATFSGGTPSAGTTIHLKYPISDTKNKVTAADWGYAAGVYTKK